MFWNSSSLHPVNVAVANNIDKIAIGKTFFFIMPSIVSRKNNYIMNASCYARINNNVFAKKDNFSSSRQENIY